MCDHTNMDVTILKDEVEVQLWEGARSSIAALMSVNANDCDCLSGANQELVDRRGLSLKAGGRTDGRTLAHRLLIPPTAFLSHRCRLTKCLITANKPITGGQSGSLAFKRQSRSLRRSLATTT